jgi:anti-sigma regulatory factor (Ser/Thr protein kinase)
VCNRERECACDRESDRREREGVSLFVTERVTGVFVTERVKGEREKGVCVTESVTGESEREGRRGAECMAEGPRANET